jgi:hypothetical protein
MDTVATEPITAQELVEHGWDAQLAELVVRDPRAAINLLIENLGWDRLDAIIHVLNPLAPFDRIIGRSRMPRDPEMQAILDRSLAQLGIELVGDNGVRFVDLPDGSHTPLIPAR